MTSKINAYGEFGGVSLMWSTSLDLDFALVTFIIDYACHIPLAHCEVR